LDKGEITTDLPFWALIILLVGLLIIELTKFTAKTPYYAEQIQAAQLMKNSLEVIKEERLKRDMLLDIGLDPNQTGIIGKEYTQLTSALLNNICFLLQYFQ